MNQYVQEIINNCKKNSLDILDLGHCSLTEMPDLTELRWISSLIFSSQWYDINGGTFYSAQAHSRRNSSLNKIPSISHSIAKIWDLRTLILTGVGLETSQDSGFRGQIDDIKFLSHLRSLEYLDISFQQIDDIEPLKHLTNLRYLNLAGNKIKDIKPLQNLTKLHSLSLRDNEISDLYPLKNLFGLSSLDLCNNQISDIEPISNLLGLHKLYFRSNKVSDISSFHKLKYLEDLSFQCNEIVDISVLSNLKKITALDISANKITNLKPIIHLVENGIEICNWGYACEGEITILGNPIMHPPMEIIEKGKYFFMKYFENTGNFKIETSVTLLKRGESILNESKKTELDKTNSIEKLIASDSLNVALSELFKIHDKGKNYEELLILHSKLSAVNKAIRLGSIDFSTASIEKTKIAAALIFLCKE